MIQFFESTQKPKENKAKGMKVIENLQKPKENKAGKDMMVEDVTIALYSLFNSYSKLMKFLSGDHLLLQYFLAILANTILMATEQAAHC